jgi:hypothetical protein
VARIAILALDEPAIPVEGVRIRHLHGLPRSALAAVLDKRLVDKALNRAIVEAHSVQASTTRIHPLAAHTSCFAVCYHCVMRRGEASRFTPFLLPNKFTKEPEPHAELDDLVREATQSD